MSRKRTCPVLTHRSPLTASTEPPRLTLLPGLLNASGESRAAIATGCPRRPHLRVYPTLSDALNALRQMGAGGAG